MVRGWILLSTLVLGVLFRLFKFSETDRVGFLFSERTLNRHSYNYFLMEHVIYLMYIVCIINPRWLRDNTPSFILWLFFGLYCLEIVHYILFFRDEGPGWNLIKTAVFGGILIWTQLKSLHQ